MRFVFYGIAAVLGLLGFIFVVGSQGQLIRIVIGIVLFVAAGGMVYLSRLQPQITKTEITQKVDLSGNVNLQKLTCNSCGAALNEKSIQVKAGAVFVHCEYCGASYQLEEDITW